MNVRIFAFILIIFAVLNVVLLALKKIDILVFWVIIAVIGVLAFKVVPKFR